MVEERDRRGIAVPGWSAGVPDFEANPALTPSEKTGAAGYPRWYDEILQQWPRAAARYGEGLAEIASMGVALTPCGATDDEPDGDETPEEAAWNDALGDLITSRLGVERGDGPAWGAAELLSLAYEAIWYGFSLAEPYWRAPGSDPMREGRIVLVPLLRAAVYRWEPDYQTMTCSRVWYQEAMGTRAIPYDELVHIAHRSAPGQYYGAGELRPLIGPFSAWRMLMTAGATAINAATGRLVVAEPEQLDGVGKARIRQLTEGFDAGRVRSFSVPAGAEYDIHTAGGAIPDIGGSLAAYDGQVDQLFQSRTSSLGITSAGSRATAEILSSEDEASQIAAWDRIVDRTVQRLAAWVARQTGYTGRIRTASTARTEIAEAASDVVPLLVQGRDLLGGWSPADADVLRERLGWQSLEAAGLAPAAAQVTPADVPGARELTGIIASLAERDSHEPTKTMREEAQRGLDWRREHGRGGTEVGIARARDIASGRMLSSDTVRRMRSYFARHEVDKQGEGWSPGEPGYPSAGRIAWALWGGDAGRTWAESIADLAEPRGCGCGSCSSASLAETVTWAGRDGVALPHPRPPAEVEVDGVVYQPELAVAWAELDDLRAILDAELAAAIGPIVAEHRAATWASLIDDGYDQAKQDAIYAEYRARYEAAVMDYYQRARDQAVDQARAEQAASDVRPTDRAGLDVEALRRWTDRQAEQARLQTRIAAETIASRVQTPVQQAYASGVQRSQWRPNQTLAGLASEAAPVASRVEAVGTLVDTAESAPTGEVVIAAVRSSMRDPNVCEWCESQDRMAWRFPEDEEAFLEYLDAHSLPDPECEGAPRCRCRITLIWGKE